MSNGKGSARRPRQISSEEEERRWNEAFGKATDAKRDTERTTDAEKREAGDKEHR